MDFDVWLPTLTVCCLWFSFAKRLLQPVRPPPRWWHPVCFSFTSLRRIILFVTHVSHNIFHKISIQDTGLALKLPHYSNLHKYILKEQILFPKLKLTSFQNWTQGQVDLFWPWLEDNQTQLDNTRRSWMKSDKRKRCKKRNTLWSRPTVAQYLSHLIHCLFLLQPCIKNLFPLANFSFHNATPFIVHTLDSNNSKTKRKLYKLKIKVPIFDIVFTSHIVVQESAWSTETVF